MSDSRSRKQWSRWAAGLLALGVGCSPVGEPQQGSPQVELTSQVQQGSTTTTTYTLTWPSNLTATGDICRFGNTSLGHQVATNTRASGRLEESLTLTGLAGRRITSLRLNGSSTQFKYDDVMLLTYNNHLVMASDRRVAQYSASPATLGTAPVLYTWSKILNGLIDNENIQAPWCSSGATTCTVPRTETTGSMDVNIPSFTAVDEAAYPIASDSRTFRLVTIGDNDASIDCRHGPVSLSVTVTTQSCPMPNTALPPTTALSYGADVLQDGDLLPGSLYSSGAGDPSPAMLSTSTDVPSSLFGTSSLYVKTGTVLNPGGTFGGLYRWVDTSKLQAGRQYRLSYHIKSLSSDSYMVRLSNQNGNGDESTLSHSVFVTPQWQYIQHVTTLNALKYYMYAWTHSGCSVGEPNKAFLIDGMRLEPVL